MITLFSYLIIFIIIPILLFLSYWIPKKLGKKRFGKILVSTLSIVTFILIVYSISEDYFFTKNNARALLEENGIILNDDFKIINNKSFYTDEFYHEFSLNISETDKIRIIKNIRNSSNYIDSISENYDLLSILSNKESPKFFANFKTSKFFVRQSYEKEKGYGPIRDIIQVQINNNHLNYQRIMD